MLHAVLPAKCLLLLLQEILLGTLFREQTSKLANSIDQLVGVLGEPRAGPVSSEDVEHRHTPTSFLDHPNSRDRKCCFSEPLFSEGAFSASDGGFFRQFDHLAGCAWSVLKKSEIFLPSEIGGFLITTIW